MNNVITDYKYQFEEINKKVKQNHNDISEDSQKIENKINVIYEGKKFMEQKLEKNERFLKDSLFYMVRYGEIMDKFIDNRTNYLFSKKTSGKQKLENLIDNKDISINSLENNKEWEYKECNIY